MRRTHRPTKKYIEIFPAALLPQRAAWQGVARSLPAGACLLVTNPENQQQTQFMLELARSFRVKGWQVTIWTARQKGVQSGEKSILPTWPGLRGLRNRGQ